MAFSETLHDRLLIGYQSFLGGRRPKSERCCRCAFSWVACSAGTGHTGLCLRKLRRLTDEDRARSLAPAGTRDGLFRIVYRFENEQLDKIINRTAHAPALTALAETAAGYRFYFAVYVREVSPFTPLYMAAINPFRKLIVYPALLRSVAAQWNATFGAGKRKLARRASQPRSR
jgi:Protein of unknown function (DUF2867)